MNVTFAVVTEGMHPIEREHFAETISTWFSKPLDDEPATATAAGDFDEATWGTDADAQARQAAAMSLFGGGATGG